MKATEARTLMQDSLDGVFKRIEESAKAGYEGIALSDYIAAENVKYLESLGYKVKTFTDGEFSESTITWNVQK